MKPYSPSLPEPLSAILRAGHLRRCHTVPSDVTHTVGHHSWGVAVILHYIYPECSKAALLWALHHDVAEGHTGDMPATAKWANPMLAQELSAAEDVINVRLGIDVDLDERETMAVKLADLLDLLCFSQHRIFMGDLYFHEVARNVLSYLTTNSRYVAAFPKALEFLHG